MVSYETTKRSKLLRAVMAGCYAKGPCNCPFVLRQEQQFMTPLLPAQTCALMHYRDPCLSPAGWRALRPPDGCSTRIAQREYGSVATVAAVLLKG